MTEPATTAPLAAATAPTSEGVFDDPDTGGPRILVRCLAAYNSGRLHGVMVDATRGENHVREKVVAMLAASPEPHAEEWAIHDYEGFEGATISEYASFKSVCALAEFITEQGTLGAKLYRHFGDDLEQARAAFDDYAGEYRSAADFAEQLHSDIGTDIPENLQYYVDWQALARDMALNGEIIVIQTGLDTVHVFWQR